jgi:hypothetical protein
MWMRCGRIALLREEGHPFCKVREGKKTGVSWQIIFIPP